MIYNVYNHCYNMQNICITIHCIYENKQKIIILRPIIHVKLNLPCTHVYYKAIHNTESSDARRCKRRHFSIYLKYKGGESMVTDKQLANLQPVRSKKEARERGRAGGKASGKKRAALKSFREIDTEQTTTEERELMLKALKKLAMNGDIRAFEVYRDTVGLKQKETLEVREDIVNPFENLSEKELRQLIAVCSED